MTRRQVATAVAATLIPAVLAGCSQVVSGTAAWPGARLERAVLTEADFPPGVRYQRIVKDAGQGDGAGAPPPMLSTPEGCTDGLTRDIAQNAERGAGSAAEYMVAYDGARMVITVLTWALNIERLAATAERCAQYETYFEPSDQLTEQVSRGDLHAGTLASFSIYESFILPLVWRHVSTDRPSSRRGVTDVAGTQVDLPTRVCGTSDRTRGRRALGAAARGDREDAGGRPDRRRCAR